MASLLDIHFADIKIVTAYQLGASRRMLQSGIVGLIVEFEILKADAKNDDEQRDFLAIVEQRFSQKMNSIEEFMGTPILNASVQGQIVDTVYSLT